MNVNELKVGETWFEKRFWNRVRRDEDEKCWEWLGSKQQQGYGRIEINAKALSAHRLSYMINVGHIYTGMVIHHKCNNKSCVNPKHLEQVTSRMNSVYSANDKSFL